MDKKPNINQLMEDLDKVMGLIKKIGEADIEDVDSLKEEIRFTRDELKNRYDQENTPKTNAS
jgi:Asp-tRNA(Asn)/Glu-tRNA(Gln) amidotransferase C subunit